MHSIANRNDKYISLAYYSMKSFWELVLDHEAEDINRIKNLSLKLICDNCTFLIREALSNLRHFNSLVKQKEE